MAKRMNMFLHQSENKSHTQKKEDFEHPFDGNSSFSLYLEPILNPYFQSYQNVISLSCIPAGPLRPMVTKIDPPRLSSFSEPGPFYSGLQNCIPVLLRQPVSVIGSGQSAFKWNDAFMGADDIPAVFDFLLNHQYHIDSSITSMLQDGPVVVGGVSNRRTSGQRKMIAFVSYKHHS
jgi:hypothetical protein